MRRKDEEKEKEVEEMVVRRDEGVQIPESRGEGGRECGVDGIVIEISDR